MLELAIFNLVIEIAFFGGIVFWLRKISKAVSKNRPFREEMPKIVELSPGKRQYIDKVRKGEIEEL